MTKQNAIHKYVREYEQYRKELFRKFSGKKIPCHNRKWWKTWHRTYKAEQLKEQKNENSRTNTDS